jgi:formamidopyrimidine-DNA glycosylase
MPELPEAETIVRGLRERVTGREIADARVLHRDVLCEPVAAFRRSVRGRRIRGSERRGKKVLLELDGGRVLLVNLGMTGRLLPVLPDGPPPLFAPTHPAVRFELVGGGALVFDDIRRFGTLECLTDDEWAERSAALGPEPLGPDFTPASLAQGLSRSRSPVRSWLLDQRHVAGVGNIYANEALWRARIHPQRPANEVRRPGAARLHEGLRDVLQSAIDAKGTTLRDYRTADGQSGSFAFSLAAYGQDGSPCPRCGAIVERVVFGNRSAFFCPRCQPLKRRGRR